LEDFVKRKAKRIENMIFWWSLATAILTLLWALACVVEAGLPQ
jgi:hypothetical protein